MAASSWLHGTLALLFIAGAPSSGAAAEAGDSLSAEIDRRAQAIEPKLIAWRRDIHQHPELGNMEVRTAKLVADHLRKLGLEVQTSVGGTGVVGLLKGGRPGPVVALRADMDALPVKEETGLPFASQARSVYEGRPVDVMHACGHDAHTAILMAVAEILAGVRRELPGMVKFIFQSAEEGPANFTPDGTRTWGAKQMVEQGVLQNPKVDAVFGLHVVAGAPSGHMAWRSGATMSAADTLSIQVKGRQTHGAVPWAGVDPIVVSAQIVLGLQTITSRQVDVTKEPSIITIGEIRGGNRNNIIPDQVTMTGTMRTYDRQMQADIKEKVTRTAELIARSAGAEAEVRVVTIYGPTINDATLTQRMAPTLKRVAGEGNYSEAPKTTASEDFSFYQEAVPGLFFFLGVTPKEQLKTGAPNHSPRFLVDDAALVTGVEALAHLAVDFMWARPMGEPNERR